MSENVKKFGLSVLACAIAVGAVLPMYEKWVKPLFKKGSVETTTTTTETNEQGA